MQPRGIKVTIQPALDTGDDARSKCLCFSNLLLLFLLTYFLDRYFVSISTCGSTRKKLPVISIQIREKLPGFLLTFYTMQVRSISTQQYSASRYFSMKHIDITILVIIQQNPTTLGRSLSLDHLNPLMKYAKHINISTSDMIAMNRITSVSVVIWFSLPRAFCTGMLLSNSARLCGKGLFDFWGIFTSPKT